MSNIIPQKALLVEQKYSKEATWQQELAQSVSDPLVLLDMLQIDQAPFLESAKARRLFAMRVPRPFIAKMKRKDPNDPLLRQVLPLSQEFEIHEGYSTDPLDEQDAAVPGLLHKYTSRCLLIVKGGCAVNCRYCFRRHFPYQENKGNKANWQQAIDYIWAKPEINEVILSGGDPLMAKDHELAWLVAEIEKIAHIKTLRIHTRLPVVIPSRITQDLCKLFSQTRLQVVLVTHINHANEIDKELSQAMDLLKHAGVTLLNQSVLLKGVNDDADALQKLSEALFAAGILPYYLHLLDKVQGAAHFYVSDDKACSLIADLLTRVSGYLVPKLTREVGGKASKTPIDLGLN